MSFCELLGNSQVKFRLQYMLKTKHIPSTLLFAGPRGVGKMLFAKAFAAELMGEKHKEKIEKGIHPDVHIYTPEGKSHTHPIGVMREMLEEMQMPPYEAPCKVFIIDDFEAMLLVSSNALLKSLEEPLENTYIIAITPGPEKLLKTILSRMHKITFFPIAQEDVITALQNHGIEATSSKEISLLSEGSLGKAYFLIDNPKHLAKERIVDLFASIEKGEYTKFIQTLAEIEKHVESLEEGCVALGIDLVFEQILYWYRDIDVLKAGQSSLFYAGEKERLARWKNNHSIPLEKMILWVGEAKVSLQHNIKLRTVLENFFLRAGSFK